MKPYMMITKGEKDILSKLEPAAQAWCLSPLKIYGMLDPIEAINDPAVEQAALMAGKDRMSAFFHGPVGSGKTFAAKAVLRYSSILNGTKVFYHTVSTMIDQVNSLAFNAPVTTTEAIGRVLEPMEGGYLLLDDIDREADTKWRETVLPTILDFLPDYNIAAIFTTNTDPETAKDNRIMSRIRGMCDIELNFTREDQRLEHHEATPMVECDLPADITQWPAFMLKEGVRPPIMLVGNFTDKDKAAIGESYKLTNKFNLQPVVGLSRGIPIEGTPVDESKTYYHLEEVLVDSALFNNCDMAGDFPLARDNTIRQITDEESVLADISITSAKHGWANKWLYKCVAIVKK